MDLKIIYEDDDVLVIDKPAGVVVFAEGKNDGEQSRTIIDLLIKKFPTLKSTGEAPRHGMVHRLDKDTSGLLLVAKTTEALIFLQKQFKNREVGKRYTTLVVGAIKNDTGIIEAPIARSPADPRKQKAYREEEKTPLSARQATTEYKVLERFKEYTLLEVEIKTGRKHQIRCHMAFIHHPVAGDKLYGFKDSPTPKGLDRQFLHASFVKITLPDGKIHEFNSHLPKDLENIIRDLHYDNTNGNI